MADSRTLNLDNVPRAHVMKSPGRRHHETYKSFAGRQWVAFAVLTIGRSMSRGVGQLYQLLTFLPWQLLLACLLPVAGFAQTLQPFSTVTGETLPLPWRIVGLPKGKAPLTTIDIVTLDDARALRLASDKSYGTALHELAPVVPGSGSSLR